MRKLLIPLTGIIALSCVPASGRLFDTPEAFSKRLDDPNPTVHESRFPFDTIYGGKINQVGVYACFHRGKCLHITYTVDIVPPHAAMVAAILEKNGGESTWKSVPGKNGEWVREDGAAFAYLTDNGICIVAKEMAPDPAAYGKGEFNDAFIRAALDKI